MASETDKHENTVVFLVAPGDKLDGRWLIEGRIGQGAMGSVFKGQDIKQNRPVAIKILAPEHCRKPKVLARFEREAKLMTTLRHPNIIQLYGVGRRGALPYIAMQLLEGMTLYDVLKRKGGKLTPGETMAIVKQISAGLSFVHHHGLVHRDIKPQNIFVGPGGRVTILDLGVVRDKSNPGLTKPGAMVGTPYYMSPEQITGTDEIDKRTDVYALAAMTFELLVGRPPFLGASNFEVLYAHRTQPPPDASVVGKGVSKEAAKALMRGMAKAREDRPQSATEFYADLEAFFGQAEKIDPAVAFAFLEEEAAKARQKEKDKAARKEKERKAIAAGVALPVKSTRAATQPQIKLDNQPVPAPARTTTNPTGQSGEIPMAKSGDVEMMSSNDLTEAAGGAAAHDAAHDTGEDEDPPNEGAGDTMAGAETEALAPPVMDPPPSPPKGVSAARKALVRDPRAETADDDEDDDDEATEASELKTGSFLVDPPPTNTVAEEGELRVVTTVKGLTTGCSLFIDDKPSGSTPVSLTLLSGRHTVRVEKQGLKPVTKAVEVVANQVTLVRLELAPPK